MVDLFLEITRSIVMAGIFVHLVMAGRKHQLQSQRGWDLIVKGFGFLVFGSVLDITDNFESLNRFVVVGDTVVQAVLEKVVGYLFGFILLFLGLLSWLPRMANRRQSSNSGRNVTSLPIVIVGILGIVISGLLFVYANRVHENSIERNFQEHSRHFASFAGESIRRYSDVMSSVRDFFNATGTVTRNGFRKFALAAVKRNPAVQALEWIPRVPAQERTAYEQAARKQGYPNFRFTERDKNGDMVPAATRKESFPVYFMEPYKGNERALGYDLASNPTRLEALERARDTGKPIATKRIKLVQEAGGQYGFLIFLPLYSTPDIPATVTERREQLTGFVLGVFRVASMFHTALHNQHAPPRFDIYVFDDSAEAGERLLYFLPSEHRSDAVAPDSEEKILEQKIHSRSFAIADRTWSVVFRPLPSMAGGASSYLPMGLGVLGLALTLFLAVHLSNARNRTKQVERCAAERSRELQTANDTLKSEIAVREKAEHALANSEQRFRHFTKVASDWIWEMGPDLRYTYMSERMTEVSKLPPSFYIGKSRQDLAGKDDAVDWDRHYDDLNNHFPFRDFEFRMFTADGHGVWASINGSPCFDDDGNFTGYRGTGSDISDRKRAEEALRASEERLADILDIAPEAVIAVNEGGHIELFNKGAEAIFGYSAEDMIGHSLDIILPPRFREVHRQFLEDFKKSTPDGQISGIRREVVGLRKDGNEFPAEAAFSKLESKGQTTLMVMMYDITERKQVERQFVHSQKMEAIGQLTGGIAHDFNNLLMVIDGYARRTLSNLNDVELVGKSVEQVLAAAEKAARLTKQLLVFSRRQVLEKRVFKVGDALRDLKGLLEHSAGEWCDLTFDVSDEGKKARTRTDSSEFGQALVNLVVNARDAMVNGGSIVIDVKLVDMEDGFSSIHGDISPGRYVRVSVTDQGTGIDDETLQHVFEPFYTTKEQGEGTGLGLAMVYGFAEQSDGAVDIATEVGKGTTFSIYLPVVDLPTDEAVAEIREDCLGKGESILLVEDDDQLLELTHDLLSDLGYKVYAACNGMEALEIDAELESQIDMVVSDVVMPSLGGFELYEILREKRPNLKALFISGYPTRGAGGGKVVIPENVPFLQKPVRPNQLAQTIRTELDKTDVEMVG